MLSLCVHIGDDISKFIKSVSAFVRNAESVVDLIYDAIVGKPKQNKITFEYFIELTSVLQKESYNATIKSIETQLPTVPIKDWIDEIKLAHATSSIATSASCQTFLDELI